MKMLRPVLLGLLIALASPLAAFAQCSGSAPANTFCGNPTGSVALPGWKAVSTIVAPSPLTRVDDTNVTLTLGGTPATALLQAVSLTMGWTGQLSLARGGTNANLTASNGGIFYSTATAGAILSGTATARQMLQSGASGAPAWSTATWPATTTVSQLLYSSSANVVAGLATANSSVLVTNGSGVPSFSTTLPALDAIGIGNSGARLDFTTALYGTAAVSFQPYSNGTWTHGANLVVGTNTVGTNLYQITLNSSSNGGTCASCGGFIQHDIDGLLSWGIGNISGLNGGAWNPGTIFASTRGLRFIVNNTGTTPITNTLSGLWHSTTDGDVTGIANVAVGQPLLSAGTGSTPPAYAGLAANFRGSSGSYINANAAAPNATTTTPVLQLQGANAAANWLVQDTYGALTGNNLIWRSARGTAASFTATQSGDTIGSIGGVGATAANTFPTPGVGFSGGAFFTMQATENWSGTAQGANASIFTTPNTTAAAALSARFHHSGGVSVGAASGDPGAGRVNVNTGYRVANAATSGNVLRGNGTDFVDAQLGIGDTSGFPASGTTTTTATCTGGGSVSAGSTVTWIFRAYGKLVWVQASATPTHTCVTSVSLPLPTGTSRMAQVLVGVVGAAGGSLRGTIAASGTTAECTTAAGTPCASGSALALSGWYEIN